MQTFKRGSRRSSACFQHSVCQDKKKARHIVKQKGLLRSTTYVFGRSQFSLGINVLRRLTEVIRCFLFFTFLRFSSKSTATEVFIFFSKALKTILFFLLSCLTRSRNLKGSAPMREMEEQGG